MRKVLFAMIVFVLCITNAYAQKIGDTVFYNKAWEEVSKNCAYFYKIIVKEGSIFKLNNFYVNGNVRMTGYLSGLNPEKRIGLYKYFSSKGILETEGAYVDGEKDGKWTVYDTTSKIKVISQYKKGELNGERIYYYNNGNIRRKEKYSNGEFVKGKCYSEKGKDTTYFPIEELPRFKGGREDLIKYFEDNLNYPKEFRKRGITGIVLVQFTVNEFGGVENVSVFKGVHPTLDSISIRLVRSMPKWNPGRKDGIPIRVKFTLPISFEE